MVTSERDGEEPVARCKVCGGSLDGRQPGDPLVCPDDNPNRRRTHRVFQDPHLRKLEDAGDLSSEQTGNGVASRTSPSG